MEEARAAAAAGRSDAAMLSAIHAAISAADAVTVALAGRRSADPDHQAVADLSDQAVQGETEGACLNKFVEHWKEHGDAIDAWLRPAVGGRA